MTALTPIRRQRLIRQIASDLGVASALLQRDTPSLDQAAETARAALAELDALRAREADATPTGKTPDSDDRR